MPRKFLFVLGIALLVAAAALFIMDGQTSKTVNAQGDDGECTEGPCPPEWIVEAWMGSAHADATAEAFVHWNEEDPKEVPVDCARCHSTPGYNDYLGADGSAADVVDVAAPTGTVVNCDACHNPVAVDLQSVTFPSGATMTSNLEDSARCMVCHQGRASGATVAAAVEGMDLDTPNADLRFINIHYFAAAASLFGSQAHGGYEYDGQRYQPRLIHVEAYNTCAECHDPHALEVKVNECAVCHTDVASVEDLKTIRMPASVVDFDGDGNLDESTFDELEGLQANLLLAIQAYATDVVGTPIAYTSETHPYFFIDTNANGEADEDEVNGDNRYASWTPRLLEAAYNFQTYEKDPGAFAHNARYHIQLMYDSIASLNEVLPTPIELIVQRTPPGHFDGTAEAFRHWDAEGEVPANCTKCHTGGGLPFMIENGVTIPMAPSTSLACTTCHENFEDYALYQTDEVKFPSGAVLTFGEGVPANICLNCHQGRESTVSVDAAIARAGVGDDEASPDLGFRNVHYFAAGATLFGSEAMGIYQYEGKEYAGRFMHVPDMDTCAACHEQHQLTVRVDQCTACHGEFEEVRDIRMMSADWDGDAADEGVHGELVTLSDLLLAAIQTYGRDVVGAPIAYNPVAYPYWFGDANDNGTVDEGEEGYANWTPSLLRAAYNYQYSQKDPGAFAHNAVYVAQALYDSLEAIGGADAVAGLTRP
jgi:hypothetical protein